MNIIIGLIGIAVGILIIKYRERLQYMTGPVPSAERYLGAGGTFALYLLIGCAVVILSILFMTGILQDTVKSVSGPFF